MPISQLTQAAVAFMLKRDAIEAVSKRKEVRLERG